MALVEPIKISGLSEFNRNLRRLNADLPKALRLSHNEAATVVVDWAKPRVPVDSGRAARSIKAASTRTESRVRGGSKSVPYYPFLDFGGRVGPNRSVRRQFYSDGRYLYPGLVATRDQVHEIMVRNLIRVAEAATFEVTNE